MKLIKSAITYRCQLPAASLLLAHLEAAKFAELTAQQAEGSGFIPVLGGSFVESFPGGYAFTFRYDEKLLPAAVVNDEVAKRVAEIEDEVGRKVPRKERDALRDSVYFEFLPRAFIKTTTVTCFYRPESRLLIVPTSSKRMADLISSRLVRAVSSIKASTIYVDGAQHGLSAKLREHLTDGPGVFGGFGVGGVCRLSGKEGRSIAFKLDGLMESKVGILEALDQGFKVTEIALSNPDMNFRINSDFVMKGVVFSSEEGDFEFETELDRFHHEAGAQTLLFEATHAALCELYEYKEPDAEHNESDADHSEFANSEYAADGDKLYDSVVEYVLKLDTVSLGVIQRQFKVGYNHACALIEQMESDGVVSDPDDLGNRDVLMAVGNGPDSEDVDGD